MEIKLIITSLLSIFFFPNLFAQSLAEDLDAIAEDFELMGMSVVTICGAEIDEVYHNGFKEWDNQFPIDDATQFRIASISKAITATGMMLLKSEQDFSFDDDISDHLGFLVRNPDYPDTPITIRQVLSHTSSLQDGNGYNGFLNATYASDETLPSIEELIVPGGDYYTTNMWRVEEPGTYFAYSNLNFGLVATLIEAISGERFDTYMDNHLFAPLNMDASYNVSMLQDISNLAVLYRNQGGWTPQVDNYMGEAPSSPTLSAYTPGTNGLRFAPQGGLRISTPDLARLMLLHMTEGYDFQNGVQLIPSNIMQEMHTPVWTYNGTNGDNYYGLFNSWGLGIQSVTNTSNGDIVFPTNQNEFLGHPGEAYGLISDFYFDKENSIGFVFLTNGAWNGFSFGDNSAFYTLEEAVFTAVENSLDCENFIRTSQQEIGVQVYPTVASPGDLIQISTSSAINHIALYSISGKKVAEHSQWKHNQFELPELNQGMYILKLIGPDIIHSQRIIIE